MLNRLHLFFALGALTVPLVVGRALAWGAVAGRRDRLRGRRRADHPAPGHPPPAAHASRGRSGDGRSRRQAARRRRRRVPLPLVVLALAIGCYVAMELGVSSWLVRYLDEAPLEVATLALSLFWASLALGRLCPRSSWIAWGPWRSRPPGQRPAASPSSRRSTCVHAARDPVLRHRRVRGRARLPDDHGDRRLALPWPGEHGQQRPRIGGDRGSIVYPPLMGVVSEAAGLWLSMLGAVLFAFAAAGCISAAAGSAGRVSPGTPASRPGVARRCAP